MPIVRMDGFKIEGVGFSQTFKSRMKFSQETVDKESSLPKKQAKTAVLEKQSVVS